MTPPFPEITGAFPATAAERRLQEYVDQGDVGTLELVQQAAREWIAALAGIAGLLGILSVVQARSSVSDLTDPWQWIVGGLLALGVLSAIGALISAAVAAQGFPDLGPLQAVAQAMATVRARFRTERNRAIFWLRCSRLLAIATVVLVLGAVGATWYGETAPPEPPPFRMVVRTDDQVACGTLAPAPFGFIMVVPDGPTGPATILVSKIREVLLVPGCPVPPSG